MLYIHHVPGRLRVRARHLRRNQKAAQQACDAAVTIAGVLEARCNTVTGSLVIRYDRRRLAPAALWQQLCERGLAYGSLPLVDGMLVARGAIRPNAGNDNGSRLFETVAGIIIDKLIERSTYVLMGSVA